MAADEKRWHGSIRAEYTHGIHKEVPWFRARIMPQNGCLAGFRRHHKRPQLERELTLSGRSERIQAIDSLKVPVLISSRC